MRRHAAFGMLFLVSILAQAEEISNSPYIDQLREEMRAREPGKASANPDGPIDPYIQSVKKRLEKDRDEKSIQSSEGYTDRMRKELGEKPSEKSLTEEEKRRLGPSEVTGAIAAVNDGHSELHAKRKGEIHNAAGIRLGTSLNRDITSATQLRPFKTVYDGNYAPDISLFYEYQPWHSEWYGNIGFFGEVSLGYFHGPGVFQFKLSRPAALGGGDFGSSSNTTFQFFSVPIIAGLDYRFNLARYVRPFVKVGPTVIGYYEGRNDGVDGFKGYSTGFYASGGVSFLMDWISGRSMQDLYSDHGVKHYYLSIDYSRLSTFSGDVSFNVSGIYAGLTFEF